MNLLRRLNRSWQKVQRDRHVKARDLSLTDSEYRLWDLFIAGYDWDKKHIQTFGTIETTDRELAKVLGWSASKVCRNRVNLIKNGLLEQIGIGTYKVPLEGLASARPQQEIAQTKQEIAPLQEKTADLQQKETQNAVSPLVSYKGNYSLLRNDQEYEELHKEFPGLEVDDMKWIDLNI